MKQPRYARSIVAYFAQEYPRETATEIGEGPLTQVPLPVILAALRSAVTKLRDVVGLYLNPPDHAVVLSVDEKSQIQALNRTQPVLPMGLGYVEGVTHDYVRHGTTTLFAALDIATGTVLTECKPRHRHQEFLSFIERIDQAVPAALDVHLIVDNYSTHKHAKVRLWLAARPPFHVHYTPTYSSWLNQVERWFGLITQQAIRRGSFKSVKDLIAKINRFTQHYNQNCRPFAWTATADSIFQKLAKLCTLAASASANDGSKISPPCENRLAHGTAASIRARPRFSGSSHADRREEHFTTQSRGQSTR
jgi:transposase